MSKSRGTAGIRGIDGTKHHHSPLNGTYVQFNLASGCSEYKFIRN